MDTAGSIEGNIYIYIYIYPWRSQRAGHDLVTEQQEFSTDFLNKKFAHIGMWKL